MNKKVDKSAKMPVKSKLKKNNNKINSKLKKAKNKIIYITLFLINTILIIYFAKKNYANFVSIADLKNIYIGSSFKNLIFGKNYIVLLTSLFFFGYTLIINKFLLHKKNTYKFIIILLLLILIYNCTLFYIFTNKIY